MAKKTIKVSTTARPTSSGVRVTTRVSNGSTTRTSTKTIRVK